MSKLIGREKKKDVTMDKNKRDVCMMYDILYQDLTQLLRYTTHF